MVLRARAGGKRRCEALLQGPGAINHLQLDPRRPAGASHVISQGALSFGMLACVSALSACKKNVHEWFGVRTGNERSCRRPPLAGVHHARPA